MKKIMMSKYGFVRWPEEDFSDDGNRFFCYKVGERVRVSKLVSDGEAYIDARIDNGTKLTYEIYSKLPHYSALGRLNGVAVSSLTEDDLSELYEACLAYEREYTEAENSIVMPTLDEIRAQCVKVRAKVEEELSIVQQLFSLEVASKLSTYEWKNVRSYYLSLKNSAANYDPDSYPQTIVNTSRSITFCTPDFSGLKDSWYYTKLLEYINK